MVTYIPVGEEQASMVILLLKFSNSITIDAAEHPSLWYIRTELNRMNRDEGNLPPVMTSWSASLAPQTSQASPTP